VYKRKLCHARNANISSGISAALWPWKNSMPYGQLLPWALSEGYGYNKGKCSHALQGDDKVAETEGVGCGDDRWLSRGSQMKQRIFIFPACLKSSPESLCGSLLSSLLHYPLLIGHNFLPIPFPSAPLSNTVAISHMWLFQFQFKSITMK
jgi:hypothetical protein